MAMEDSSSAAMAWIDDIIKDLIHSSSHISIHQLIHNVWKIIHPCNPSLAAVLKCRLRSLIDSDYPTITTTTTTTTTTERRGSSSIIRSSLEFVQRHLHHHQTNQQKGGLVQFQGQGSSSSSASAADLKLHRDFSDLDNTLPSSAAASHPTINHYLNWGVTLPTTKNMVTPTNLTPSNQNQMHKQSSQQLHPQEQQQDYSPVGAGAAT